MKHRFFMTYGLLILLLIIGCGKENTVPETVNTQTATQNSKIDDSAESTKGSLLFFMNPNGRPCQC